MATLKDRIAVRIRERREEAENIFSVVLVPTGIEILPMASAGSHVDVEIEPGCIRQYSLCHDPRESGAYRIAILRDARSRGGSRSAFASFTAGREIAIGMPRNSFALKDEPGPSYLFAGGIGITPLLAMAYQLAQAGRPFQLRYFTRSPARTAFLDEIARASFAASVSVRHDDLAGGPFEGSEVPLFGGEGRIYVCGPQGFIDRVCSNALRNDWPSDRIEIERFQNDVERSGEVFTVIAERSGVELMIEAGDTIANRLLDAGVDVPLSCEEGICGACLTPILEGIPDHRDVFQTDEEKAANTHMTVCCSRSRSPVIRLDI